ncbi:NAD(P)-dependent oxidoreductase [Candidatus Woesearchaeota archaeon]|nr:NAD(P)-dependent oxidoreductase [Candidatus Woesearchaeota archaeon]
MVSLKGRKILLIGGTGFIGLHLAKRLLELGSDVAIFGKNEAKKGKLDFRNKINFIKGDVVDYKAIEKSVKNKDAIINLAAVVQDYSEFDPYLDLEVNCKGQLNILEARKRINQKAKYIFMGSRTQFGRVNEKDLPVHEDLCQRPISLYGIHKSTAENYCSLYKMAFNLKSIILRLPQVYGPSLAGKNAHSIVDRFIRKALINGEFGVNGYGKDIKDLIYVEDVVDLMVRVLESEIEEGAFNVGSGKKVKLIEIAEKIVKLCGSGSFRAVPFPEELVNFELGGFYFDISKAKKAFNWSPKIKIEEGLKKTIDFYRNKGG